MRLGASTVLSVATILVASGGAAAVNFQVLDQSMSVRFDRHGLGAIAPSAQEIEVDDAGKPVEQVTVSQSPESEKKNSQNTSSNSTPKSTPTRKVIIDSGTKNQASTPTPTKTTLATVEPEPTATSEEQKSNKTAKSTETPKPTKTKAKEKEDDDEEDEDDDFEDEDD